MIGGGGTAIPPSSSEEALNALKEELEWVLLRCHQGSKEGVKTPSLNFGRNCFPLSAKLLSSPTPREKEQRSEELIILFPRRKNTHFPFSFQPGTVESSTTPTFFTPPFPYSDGKIYRPPLLP